MIFQLFRMHENGCEDILVANLPDSTSRDEAAVELAKRVYGDDFDHILHPKHPTFVIVLKHERPGWGRFITGCSVFTVKDKD